MDHLDFGGAGSGGVDGGDGLARGDGGGVGVVWGGQWLACDRAWVVAVGVDVAGQLRVVDGAHVLAFVGGAGGHAVVGWVRVTGSGAVGCVGDDVRSRDISLFLWFSRLLLAIQDIHNLAMVHIFPLYC